MEKEKKENVFSKILNKNNLSFILFLIVFINYLPLFINNITTKTSNAVGIKQMVIAFALEGILLFIYLIKNLKFTKQVILHSVLLLVITAILLGVQCKNYFAGTLQMMDLANIACITINIIILFIVFLEVDVEEKSIYKFYAGIVFIGILACIVNVFLYNSEMLKVLGINGTSRVYNIKSFFAHRNQLANFLYFSIISDILLFIKNDKKSLKVLLGVILVFFAINLFFTASRTGILCTLIFAGLFFLTTDRLKTKTKIIISVITITLLSIVAGAVFYTFPEIWEKVINMIQKVFIRSSTIKTFTGRATFWNLGTELLFQNPISAMFGVGRFVALELIKNYKVTQFHSFYVEALMAGGIMELLYLLFIYFTVIKKVIKSGIEKRYKITYVCLYISYAIYCGFESLGRFSIGCVDTMCLIFLITIPLLHSNSNILLIAEETSNIEADNKKIKEKMPYRRKGKH